MSPRDETSRKARATVAPRNAVFGRRKGHALRKHQIALIENLLPRLRIDLASPAADLAALFGVPVREIWLEIGFGGGEHLVWQAVRNPDIGCIGCEPFVNGVARLLTEIERHALANIRIHDDDAGAVLDWLPDAALGRVFILHPDPWPKKRHWKRRFVNADSLENLARVMAPGAELRIASDWPDYIDWIMRLMAVHPAFVWTARSAADWSTPPDDWPRTRYEAKAILEGRAPTYLSFRRA